MAKQQTPDPASAKSPAKPAGIRIAKAMADAGLCSRREAERWIDDGRVSLNGKKLDTPAVTVTASDRVLVDGTPLPGAQEIRMWRYHKPRGLVTTNSDPEGRPTVFEKLDRSLPRVVSVGRLDYNTEGLLLLTTNGALARHLELPRTGWRRNYRVRAKGRVTQEQLDALKTGVKIDGITYGGITAILDERSAKQQTGSNLWLSVTLKEGKNREVRLVLGSLGLIVSRLIRVSYGPFSLGEIKPGECEEIRMSVLADQIGPAKAQELGIGKGASNGTAAEAQKSAKPKSKKKPARPRNPQTPGSASQKPGTNQPDAKKQTSKKPAPKKPPSKTLESKKPTSKKPAFKKPKSSKPPAFKRKSK